MALLSFLGKKQMFLNPNFLEGSNFNAINWKDVKTEECYHIYELIYGFSLDSFPFVIASDHNF